MSAIAEALTPRLHAMMTEGAVTLAFVNHGAALMVSTFTLTDELLKAPVAGLIAGCGTPPQTPQGFRAVVRDGHSLFQIDTFTVDRPLSVVGGALQRKADECLHARVTTHGAGVFGFGSGSSQVRAVSTPTVRRSPDRVELDLQVDVKASIKVHAEPPGGVVSFAVDAVPAGPGRVR